MKKVLLVIGLVVLAIACDSKTNASAKVKKENLDAAMRRDASIKLPAKIKFDLRNYNFGEVQEGDTVRHKFKVTNIGGSDLIIAKAKASCGCTASNWPKTPIKPGKYDFVSIEFNTRGKKGNQNKSVTLTTNTEKGNESVTISGKVNEKK